MYANLAKALPEKTPAELRRIARESYAHFALTCLEFLASARLFPATKAHFDHPERMEKALDGGGGAYVLCLHLSNWELLCSICTRRFSQVHVVTKKVGSGAIANWVSLVRKRNGMAEIDRSGSVSATHQIFQALRAGEIVAVMADQRRRKGALLPFFGHLSWTNTGLAQMALRQPAPIIPCSLVRAGRGERYTMVLHPEFILEQPPGMGFKECVLHNTARLNLLAERMILERPEQYFWFHKRWKEAGDAFPPKSGTTTPS